MSAMMKHSPKRGKPGGRGGKPDERGAVRKQKHGKSAAKKPGGAAGVRKPGRRPPGPGAAARTTPAAATGNKPSAASVPARERSAKADALKTKQGLIQDAVKLWEEMRPKQTSAQDKARLVDQIMKLLDGRLVDLAANHTASRVIQFCTKYGTTAQRTHILTQTKANMVVLAKSKYGHHLVRKLINKSTKEQVPDLVRAFQGHVAELLRHPQGADVVMDLYDVAPTPLRNAMCAEFYGREFVLFGGVGRQGAAPSGLGQLLEGADASRRRAVMQHMTKALVPIMEKGLLHPPITHRLLREFFERAPGLSIEDAVDTLAATGASLLKMVHTHDGAAAVCAVLGYGTAKDRKRVVKAMKGHVGTMAVNEWGYTVLLAVLSMLDDTSLVSKIVCSELRDLLPEAVEDVHAARVLLHLLSPRNKRYLSGAALAMLHPPRRTVRGGSNAPVTDIDGDEEGLLEGLEAAAGGSPGEEGGDLLALKRAGHRKERSKGPRPGTGQHGLAGAGMHNDAEGDGDGGDEAGQEHNNISTDPSLQQPEERVLGVSKKADDVRRRELLASASGKEPPFGAALAVVVAGAAGALLHQPVACDLVVEVCRGGDDGMLASVAPAAVEAAHEAVVADAAGATGDATAEDDAEAGPAALAPAAEHLFEHYYASRALRRLILASTEAGPAGEAASRFAQTLWQSAVAGRCERWVGGHGEKVLGALLHCGSPAVRAAIAKELQPLVKPQSVKAWGARFVAKGAATQPSPQPAAETAARGEQAPVLKAGKAVTAASKGGATGTKRAVGPDKQQAASAGKRSKRDEVRR